ncbi:MAG: WGR domain-containing protein [Cyanobacteria bacterium J06621_8]
MTGSLLTMQYQLKQWQYSSWVKDTRFYSIRLCQNLFGDWVVQRTWGRNMTQGAGQSLTTDCDNYQQGLAIYQQQQARRLKRGYILYRTHLRSQKKSINDPKARALIKFFVRSEYC